MMMYSTVRKVDMFEVEIKDLRGIFQLNHK